eukprot:3708232-Amphidinium_carterae.1
MDICPDFACKSSHFPFLDLLPSSEPISVGDESSGLVDNSSVDNESSGLFDNGSVDNVTMHQVDCDGRNYMGQ